LKVVSITNEQIEGYQYRSSMRNLFVEKYQLAGFTTENLMIRKLADKILIPDKLLVNKFVGVKIQRW